MIRARLSFNASIQAMLGLTAKWPQAVAKLVEDKANGPAIMSALGTRIGGMIPVEPRGSKYSRAAAVSPFAHAHNIILPTPELLPNVAELTEEAKSFPNGTHDDTVDAMSQAADQLLYFPVVEDEQDLTGEDLIEDTPNAWLAPY